MGTTVEQMGSWSKGTFFRLFGLCNNRQSSHRSLLEQSDSGQSSKFTDLAF